MLLTTYLISIPFSLLLLLVDIKAISKHITLGDFVVSGLMSLIPLINTWVIISSIIEWSETSALAKKKLL